MVTHYYCFKSNNWKRIKRKDLPKKKGFLRAANDEQSPKTSDQKEKFAKGRRRCRVQHLVSQIFRKQKGTMGRSRVSICRAKKNQKNQKKLSRPADTCCVIDRDTGWTPRWEAKGPEFLPLLFQRVLLPLFWMQIPSQASNERGRDCFGR